MERRGGLLQRLDASTVVDVVGLAGQHECGHGFHAGFFRLGDAVEARLVEAGAVFGAADFTDARIYELIADRLAA